ncbi:hypothetical protein FA13DRAFT_1747890, partial [Coprinellus micaceus]
MRTRIQRRRLEEAHWPLFPGQDPGQHELLKDMHKSSEPGSPVAKVERIVAILSAYHLVLALWEQVERGEEEFDAGQIEGRRNGLEQSKSVVASLAGNV